jgi:hypothetical protein
VLILSAVAPYVSGDLLRVEVISDTVYYKKNGVLLYTSTTTPIYPLVVDIALNQQGATLGPLMLSGTWTVVDGSTDAIWLLNLLNQTWSRTVYTSNFLSMFRDSSGALLVGSNDGSVWEIDTGRQDDGADIAVDVLGYMDDGGEPLARKDALDFQIHVDTGSKDGVAAFLLDGDTTATASFTFNTNSPQVYRINSLSLGVFLRAQIQISGTFNRFVLHAFNLQYRNRVQQVMVLDTGTISPMNLNRICWLSEAEIDCISPVDLLVNLYLDDTLKTITPLRIAVIPNKRSTYRFELPRGSKARAPRLVFVTTNSDGQGNQGFEPYRVRVRDRGTGKQSEAEFRPIWPVGTAP